MLLRVEIHLAEREPRLEAELVGVRLQIRVQFGVGRLGLGGDVVGDEFHLLLQAAADDGVVLVQAQRQRLAVVDFLPHAVPDQPSHSSRVGGRCRVRVKLSLMEASWPCVMTILPGSPPAPFDSRP